MNHHVETSKKRGYARKRLIIECKFFERTIFLAAIILNYTSNKESMKACLPQFHNWEHLLISEQLFHKGK